MHADFPPSSRRTFFRLCDAWAITFDPTTSELRPRRSDVWGPMAHGLGSLWIVGGMLPLVLVVEVLFRYVAAGVTKVADLTCGIGADSITGGDGS